MFAGALGRRRAILFRLVTLAASARPRPLRASAHVRDPRRREAARRKVQRNAGTSSTSHGRARMLPTIPRPYAIPKCRKVAGDTTSTSTPRARTRSTASATKRPAESSGPRGYDVVRTRDFHARNVCPDRTRRENVGACNAPLPRSRSCSCPRSASCRAATRRTRGSGPAHSPPGRAASRCSSRRARARCDALALGRRNERASALDASLRDLVGAMPRSRCSSLAARSSTRRSFSRSCCSRGPTPNGCSYPQRTLPSPRSSSTRSHATCSAHGATTSSSSTSCSSRSDTRTPSGSSSVLGLLLALGIVAGASVRSRGRACGRCDGCPSSRLHSTSAAARRRSSRSASASPSSRCSRRRRCASLAAAAVLLPAAAVAAACRLGEPLCRDCRRRRASPAGRSLSSRLACAALAAAAVAAHPAPPPAQPPSRRLRLLVLGARARRCAWRRGRRRALRLDRAARVVLPRRVARRVPRASAARHRRRHVRALLGAIRARRSTSAARSTRTRSTSRRSRSSDRSACCSCSRCSPHRSGVRSRGAAPRTCRPRSARMPPSSSTPGSTGTGSCPPSSSRRSVAPRPSRRRSSSRDARSASRARRAPRGRRRARRVCHRGCPKHRSARGRPGNGEGPAQRGPLADTRLKRPRLLAVALAMVTALAVVAAVAVILLVATVAARRCRGRSLP